MKGKKAAMEMSIGTLVTIVLLMAVLILGVFLVQKIFSGSSDAVDTINNEVINQINSAFSDSSSKLAVVPPSREVDLKKGEDPKGFAFSVINDEVESAQFTYQVIATDVSRCGSTMSEAKAESYLLPKEGQFSLGPSGQLDPPRLFKFEIPESAPSCTMIYQIEIMRESVPYASADLFVNVK